MPTVSWEQLGLASNLVRHLRAVNRVTRTEIDGHVYAYPDLKEAWLSEDGNHILLTHHKDPVWCHWVQNGDWRFVGVYPTEQDAENAVLDYVLACPTQSGTYVQAQRTPESRVIRVRCESEEGPEFLRGVFSRLGYATTIETVA